MLADNLLPVVMQLCYFLGHRNENEAKSFGISKDWLSLENKDLKTTKSGELLALSLLSQNGTRSSYNSFWFSWLIYKKDRCFLCPKKKKKC